ncbi:hypothetical protein D3C71_2198200 [compost metagenome]
MSGDGRHIVCFAHGALFQPDNGFCLLGPCQGQSLQALMVKLDVSGNVWLEEGGPRANDEVLTCASMG